MRPQTTAVLTEDRDPPGAGGCYPSTLMQLQMWILGGVFALVGVPMIALAMRAFAKGRAIAAWPRAPGVVISARLDSWSQTSRDRDGFNRTDRMYRPIVEYTYDVEGRTLQGDRIDLESAATGRESAQRVIDAYPPSKPLMVLYDPKDPATAYLQVRTSIGGVILACFGGFWIALGALLVGLSFL